jgi:hypothetical protein
MDDGANDTQTTGIVPMTEAVWNQILKYYLITYRGPNDEEHIRQELKGYHVLTRTGRVNVGRYVRYLRRGLIDNDLRRGGYVVKCNSKTLTLENGTRRWKISRAENYIFVGEAIRKTETRLLAEALLKADDEYRAQTVKVNFRE